MNLKVLSHLNDAMINGSADCRRTELCDSGSHKAVILTALGPVTASTYGSSAIMPHSASFCTW